MPLNLIVCGFLGSGKTTLIRRIVREALADRRVVVVENESGRESVDGLYLRDGGLKVVDLRAGCVCCTLRGEMAATMERIRTDFDPDCVFLEPSGLGDLADLLRIPGFEPDGVVMLVDVERFDLLLKLNRDHFLRQFRLAPVIVLTRTDLSTPERTAAVRDELERINPRALIVEGCDAFDGRWWLEIVPERYAAFRAFFPVLPAGGPRFVTETFSVGRTVSRDDLAGLFARLAERDLMPVRAKGCLHSDAGWMKADWLAPGQIGCTPVAEAPENGGFLTCWWVDAEAGQRDVADAAKACLKEWIYGTK